MSEPYEIVGEILLIPLVHIYVDTEFNCRGFFNPTSVFNLGKSIIEIGQKVPLIVQPIEDVSEDEKPDPCDYKFRLIAGHRRHMALDLWTSINRARCIIEYGLTKQQSRALNFTENLRREDLNILEEAEGLERSWPTEDVKEIASFVNESRRWVKIRKDLLKLPDYVKRKVSLGIMGENDIETLTAAAPDNIEYAFQQLLKDKDKPRHLRRVRGKRRSRARGVLEIRELISFLYSHQSLSDMSKESLATAVSTLAWVSQGIDSQEFLENRLAFIKGCIIIDGDDKVIGLKEED